MTQRSICLPDPPARSQALLCLACKLGDVDEDKEKLMAAILDDRFLITMLGDLVVESL